MILTQCSVEKNTGTTRFYHSLTSKYNIYFNGYESFKSGVDKINKGYKDDYAELLKVFEFSDPSTASLCSSDMERAIQKASKLISLKSITARPEFNNKRELSEKEKAMLEQKEFNEWVDDSYLLIGKARFYKHEFKEAEAVFNYCIAEANDPEIKVESSVWLARIKDEEGNFTESGRILNEIEITSSSPKTLKAMYYTTLADMFIKQKKYTEATDPLTLSIKYIAGKRARHRFTYLLAQLYERAGNSNKAISLYKDVVKMNPPYDVEFNARINIAGVFDVNSGDPQELRKELEKMLKDVKNKEFQDQIYYALGNLMMKGGNEAEALNFYKKSASSGSTNTTQKGKSYLALANHYYDKPDYMEAGKYFDSTIYFLDQKYPDYKEIQTKTQNLNALVAQLKIIQTEDSLQKVALMPQGQRDALIARIISKAVKAESEGKTSEYTDRYNVGQSYENARRAQNNITQEGKWYFYNQTALTFGRSEFRKKWGDRKLEDNWRRSNKAKVNVQQANGEAEEKRGNGTDTSKAISDNKKPQFYLKDLPMNDSLIALSNDKIANAYFSAGEVFYEKIKDQNKAAESFEKLISRFPNHELIPEALYTLYSIFKDTDKPRSETYRQRLLGNYPENEFAKILSDPEYYSKKIGNMKMVEGLYNDAYNAYISENFSDAISRSDSAIKNYPKDALAPKFMLLHAYATARVSDERTFKEELNNLVKTWPGTNESKRAEELITYLNQVKPELKIEEEKEIATELYVADTLAIHSFVLIIMDPSFNINQASFDVISYNIDNYTNKNYRSQGISVDNKYIMITVSGFNNNKQAWDYYSAFNTSAIIRNSSTVKTMKFLINSNNLKALEKDKNPERYDLFFNENYLNGGRK